MAVIIHVDGTVTPVTPRAPARGFDAQEIKKFIGGGWIELIKLAPVDFIASIINTDAAAQIANDHPDDWLYLIIDEEGKLKNMPMNPLATKFYRACHGSGDFIVGDALLCVVHTPKHENDEEIIS